MSKGTKQMRAGKFLALLEKWELRLNVLKDERDDAIKLGATIATRSVILYDAKIQTLKQAIEELRETIGE